MKSMIAMLGCCALGFAVGTTLCSLFVLSVDPVDRLIGGAFFGGIPAGLAAAVYGYVGYRV